jgi:hypothetical protein
LRQGFFALNLLQFTYLHCNIPQQLIQVYLIINHCQIGKGCGKLLKQEFNNNIPYKRQDETCEDTHCEVVLFYFIKIVLYIHCDIIS